MIPQPTNIISSRGGFDESESDDEVDENDEGLSPEERRAKARKTLSTLSEKLPHLRNIPGLGARRRQDVEGEAESPSPDEEPPAVSMGGARGR